MTEEARRNTGTDYLEAAAEDLQASALLLESGMSRLGIYHLNQATEKTLKALLLAESTIPMEKFATHNTIGMYADHLLDSLSGPIGNSMGDLLAAMRRIGLPEEMLTGLKVEAGAARARQLKRLTATRKQVGESFPSYLEPTHEPGLTAQLDALEWILEWLPQQESILKSLSSLLATDLQAFAPDLAERVTPGYDAGTYPHAALPMLVSILVLHDQDPRYPPLGGQRNSNWARYTADAPLVQHAARVHRAVKSVHRIVSTTIAGKR